MKDRKDTTALERRADELRRSRDMSRVSGWRDQRGEDWEDSGWNEPRVPRDENGWPIEPAPGNEVDADADAMLLSDWLDQQHVIYESPREYARTQAQAYLFQHVSEEADPDELLMTTLYINQWEKEPGRAKVAYSMTLTEAFMRDWQQNGNGQFFNHLGHLSPYKEGGYPARVVEGRLDLGPCRAYEAIYRKTSPQRYDRSTHMAINPQDFKLYVWDFDLQSHYQDSLKRFWHRHGDDYNLLIKAALLKSAFVQHQEGSLSAEDKELVLRALGLTPDQTWDALTFRAFADAPLPHDVTIRELILYRYVATDIIVIRDEHTDRLVMYVPGNSSPLHAFQHLSELRSWIALQCQGPRRRKALEGHFKVEDVADGFTYTGLHQTLAGLAAFPHKLDVKTGHWDPTKIVHLGDALSPWPFSHFKYNVQSRLESDGNQLIRSQADYNKEISAEVLYWAVTVTGVVAMAVPALWIPLAAMSVALVGLGIDEAIEGRTLEERQDGVDRIVFGVLNAVPAVIGGAAASSRLAAAATRVAEETASDAVDEIGQMIADRSPEEKAVAVQQQQRAQAESIEEELAQASESASDRQARLSQEEQDRIALKAHRINTYDSIKAFGVEPEGLRSLQPALRASLARFEYGAALGDIPGAWQVDDLGAVYKVEHPAPGETAYFAPVHAKVYPVEPVEKVGQYRIFSAEDPQVKGPYVKPASGFYSDIDLRPGLRGGASFIEESPQTALPGERGEITLTRAQPPVTVEIPMDGIEMRWVENEEGKQVLRYFANNVPEGTKVAYNAEVACWESSNERFLWLDNKGRWRTGTETDYLRVRDNLRAGVRDVFYTFRRLPGVPANAEPVEQVVHQVWLGRRLPSESLIENIKSNMRISPELKFTMHVDIDDTAASDGLYPPAQLQNAFADFPNMTISRLQDEPFFEGFMNDPHTSTAFSCFRRGELENFAAASDILRYRLIREYGGIYMDCDDVIGRSFSGAELLAGPHDVLVGGTLESPTLSFRGPGNSHFASRPGNPVFREMEREIHTRFTRQYAALEALTSSRHQSKAAMTAYMTQISEVTGPRLFLDVIKETRPDYADLLDDGFKMDTNVYASEYYKRLNRVKEFYRPFASRFRIFPGAENSWKAPGA